MAGKQTEADKNTQIGHVVNQRTKFRTPGRATPVLRVNMAS